MNNWFAEGWLVSHKPDRREINELLRIADRDISDAQAERLSTDSRLSIAYNAALQLAIAALAAEGYRAVREGQHYRAIQSLPLTVGANAGLVRQLDSFRRKRNISEYERAGAVSDAEAREMLALAKTLRTTINEWLKTNHPELT